MKNEVIIIEKLSETIKDFNAEYGNKKFNKIIDLPGIVVTIRDSALALISDLYLYRNFQSYRTKYDNYIQGGQKDKDLSDLYKLKISNYSRKKSPEGDENVREMYNKYNELSKFKAGREKPTREVYKEYVDYINYLIENIVNRVSSKNIDDNERFTNLPEVPKILFEKDTVTQAKVESLFSGDMFRPDADEWTLNTQEYTIMQIIRFMTDFVFNETPSQLKDRRIRNVNENEEILISRRISFRLEEMKLDKRKLSQLRNSLYGIWQNNNLIILIDKIIDSKNPSHWAIWDIVRKYSNKFDNMDFFKPAGIKFTDLMFLLDFYSIKEQKENRLELLNDIKQIYTNYDKGASANNYKKNIEILNDSIYTNEYIEKELNINEDKDNNEKIEELFSFFNKAFGYSNTIDIGNYHIHYEEMHKIRKLNQLSMIKTYVYFNMQDRFKLSEILNIIRNHEFGEDVEKKEVMKIIFIYERLKEYFDLNIDSNDDMTLGYGTGSNLYTDDDYINYILELKKARTKFLENFIMPITNSLDILGEDKSFIIYNDLRRIVQKLDRTWFFIPPEFNDKKAFFKNVKSRFIFEEVSMSLTKWTQYEGKGFLKTKTGTRYLPENFNVSGNIYEEVWWSNLFNAIEKEKETIYQSGNIEVLPSYEKGLTKFDKKDGYYTRADFEVDWNNWINHLKSKQSEYLQRFDSNFIQRLNESIKKK